MRTALLRPAVSFILFVLLLASTLTASAGNPYLRALQHGRRYVHRPIYKQYQHPTHKSHRGLWLFKK
ncbi:hypothetical protein [Hymenobacter metallicola]|uniref:Uncharacterized protein n=1 Tax=Hymenobacter metallicola TaxID=2563114 RepID=A0A4Z0Q1H1_9BACT|nr:hypothetical protein [Hymenobacter metallicola]TGE22941.1 hypothetical protein E5K02_21500 [Hymenobacter metallicola]